MHTMEITYFSYVLGSASVLITWMMSRKLRWAWLALAAIQVPYVIYYIASRQYGFLVLNAANVIVAARGWTAWRRAERTPR